MIGVSKQLLNYWNNSLLPYDKAVAIYIFTDGKVSLEELRPDKVFLTMKLKAAIKKEISKNQ